MSSGGMRPPVASSAFPVGTVSAAYETHRVISAQGLQPLNTLPQVQVAYCIPITHVMSHPASTWIWHSCAHLHARVYQAVLPEGTGEDLAAVGAVLSVATLPQLHGHQIPVSKATTDELKCSHTGTHTVPSSLRLRLILSTKLTSCCNLRSSSSHRAVLSGIASLDTNVSAALHTATRHINVPGLKHIPCWSLKH